MDQGDVTHYGYAYNFNEETPLWRYIFIGALTPYITLRVMGHIQNRVIPRGYRVIFCCIGGYLGAKHAFNQARVPIDDPDGIGPILPFELYLRRVYDFDSNRPSIYKWRDRDNRDKRSLPRPSIDDIVVDAHRQDTWNSIDHHNSGSNQNYSDEMEYRISTDKRGSRSKRSHYDDYGNSDSPNTTYDPTEDIASFFESSDPKKRRS